MSKITPRCFLGWLRLVYICSQVLTRIWQKCQRYGSFEVPPSFCLTWIDCFRIITDYERDTRWRYWARKWWVFAQSSVAFWSTHTEDRKLHLGDLLSCVDVENCSTSASLYLITNFLVRLASSWCGNWKANIWGRPWWLIFYIYIFL